jgi:type VI secretion system secreted protein VgrG
MTSSRYRAKGGGSAMTAPVISGEEWKLYVENAPTLDIDEICFDDAVDDLYRVEIVARCADHALDLRELAGSRLLLSFQTPLGRATVIGLIANAALENIEESGISRFRLIAMSPVWLTTLRKACRIFQYKTVAVLVEELLGEYEGQIPVVDRSRVQGHAVRRYVTQYKESDWEFVRRLLADDGVSMFPLHDGSGRVLLIDDTRAATGVSAPIRFVAHSQLAPTGFHVHHAHIETAVATKSVTRRDYDWPHPNLKIDGKAVAIPALAVERPLEDYQYDAGFVYREREISIIEDPEAPRQPQFDSYAQKRLEEVRAPVRATFDCNFHLPAGAAFWLADHPRDDANIEWLVLRATTRAAGRNSSHRLHCVPLTQRHRPRILPKPRIIGTQTAFVVGEPGKEIDVNEDGQVRVKFHWDRRKKSHDTSRWLRVSQGWAGPAYGFVAHPRVGDEVIVDFLDGDPDLPIVIGRVFNGVNVAPQTLPAQATRTTWRSRTSPGGEGFNELSFEDAAKAELVYLRAQRDAEVDVLTDVRIRVGGHVYSNVKGNTTSGVQGSGSLSIKGDADVDIGGDLKLHAVNINASADANIVLSAGDQRHDESTNHFVKTSGFYVRAGGVAQFVTPNFHVFSGNIRLVAGGSEIEITNGGIAIKSSGPVTINGSVVKLNC